jgi:hypothetical protein
VSILAAEQAVADVQPEAALMVDEAQSTSSQGRPCPMHGKGMKHKGMMHKGSGQHRMAGHGMERDKGKHEKHAEVVRRLDMIEARMAKIEAMLESLMRRQ